MNKWYQEIIVEHKELDNKMYHCFDDENFEKLTNERNEQLKEIERLNNIINELEDYICVIEYDERHSDSWQIPVRIHNKLKELKGSYKENKDE